MDLQKTGALIARARKEKGLTQEQLAKQLHISHTTVSKWERGLGFPEVSLLEPLAAALDLTLDQLFKGEEMSSETEPVTEPQEPASHSYIKAAVFGLVLLAFVMLCGWSGQVNRKYGGDPTTIRGTWQHVPLPSDEEHYLVTLTADLHPTEQTYRLYIDDRLVDQGIWSQEEGYVIGLDGELFDTTVELTGKKGYGEFQLNLPGLKNTLYLRKRGDVILGMNQDGYTDQAEYQRLLTGE